MDYFYDGQIRRYVTQFMRIFIGIRYKAGKEVKAIPVSYGDMTRQVANIIKENSENKLPSVPKIACYITGIELDKSRLADASFVSKVQVRERRYDEFYPDDHPEVSLRGTPIYENNQGAGYTVERLMPTPFLLSMRADLWTSNTDQKLQILEQLLVLFNPSLEVQTTDNFIDWTSLTTVYLNNSNWSSRTIPVGVDSDIDITTLDFEIPIFISPPVKVKKLGVVNNIIMNIFSDDGNLLPLSEITFNDGKVYVTPGNYGVLLLKSSTGDDSDNIYDVTVLNPSEALTELRLQVPIRHGDPLDWHQVLSQYEGYRPGISQIRFLQPSGNYIIGTFVINELDSTKLSVSVFEDMLPTNTELMGRTTIDAVIDPQKFNPIEFWEGIENINSGKSRYLILEDIGDEINTDGPDAWKGLTGTDFIASANSIIEWDGINWKVVFDPNTYSGDIVYITNLKTGIQYKWEDSQWLKSFEGEYSAGYWSFDLNP